jgi:HK97 family phage portal protein
MAVYQVGGLSADQVRTLNVGPVGVLTGWTMATDPDRAKGIPEVARALGIVASMPATMPMNAWVGAAPSPWPWMILTRPDPDAETAWFVEQNFMDWWIHGNAISLVTSRSEAGWPLTMAWVPAPRVAVTEEPVTGAPIYWVDGVQVPSSDVIHVRRGANRWNTLIGVGVVEQHLASLGKVADQEAYEARVLDTSAVPSVAIVVPNSELSQEEADAAKSSWMEKFSGPTRAPAVLPNGTEIVKLAWSPADQELSEARKLSRVDVANMFNLDSFWLGGETAGMTYKSPGPMFLMLMRQTLGLMISQFEQAWGKAWLPPGTDLRFDRQALLGDDMPTTVAFLAQAVSSKILTRNEARSYLGKAPVDGGDEFDDQPAAPVAQEVQA